MKNKLSRWPTFLVRVAVATMILMLGGVAHHAQAASIASLELGTTSYTANTTGAATFTTKDANIASLPALSLTLAQQGTHGGTGYVSSKNWNKSSQFTDRYWSFTITANSGYQISASSITIRGQRSSTGPTDCALRSDADGYAANIATQNSLQNNGTDIVFSGLTLTNKSSITFQVYGWGTTFGAGTWWIGDGAAGSLDIDVQGTVTPMIVLADNGTQVAAATISAGTTGNVLLQFQTTVNSVAAATLNSVSFTTAGTYAASDLSNLKLWYNGSGGFSGATQIGSSLTGGGIGAGTQTFSSLSQTVNSGDTGHFFITADVASGATAGHTVSVSALAGGNLTFASGTPIGSTSAGGTQTIQAAVATPPTLTAAGGATVDGAFNVTFTDSSAWRSAITGIKVGGTTLSASAYGISSGQITFTPSASTLLQSSGAKSIAVQATGYGDAMVSQAIGVGAANKLAMTTQPTAPASNGGALATQPTVMIQDQYGNPTASAASVTAAVGSGTWTLGGTTSVNAAAGVATFSGLTATSASAVSGATIAFTSTGLTGATSSGFNIPAVSAPSVSTQLPTVTNTATATLAGTIINNNGAAITDYGFYWSATSPVTTGSTKAQVGTGNFSGAYAKGLTGLNADTIYYYRAYAVNSAGTTLDSAEVSFSTLANRPNPPIVSGATTTTLNVSIASGDGNSSTTTYAIRATNSILGIKYAQADGSLNNSAIFQTAAAWGTVTVTGLSSATTYTIEARAKNAAGITSGFNTTPVTGTTLGTPTYATTYNANGANGGSVPTDGTAYANGATVTAQANSGALTKTGYTFANWNSAADGSGTTYAAGSGTFTITSNTTLYASWTINTYTLTYNAGTGGTVSGVTPQTVNYNASGTQVTAMANTGYHFATWSDGVSTSNRTDVALIGGTNVTASFAIITYNITGTTNVPTAPNATNATWVTTHVSSSTSISAVTLTYDAGGGPTNVTMFDDGSHQDGAAGDGTYGGQIPAFPEAATVRYYVTASNAPNMLVTDPASAPTNTYSYTVLSPDLTTPFAGSIVLGRPTDHSIVVSVLATNNLQFYLEYGLAPGVYPNQTAVTNVVGGLTTEVFLNQLSANTRYYYRMHYMGASDTNYLTDARHTFITQRPPGSTFTFCIHGDSHPERTNNMYDPNFYQLTLNTAAADQPDFYMTVGDDFSVDQIGSNNMSQAQVTYRYTLQRGYLGLVGNSAPIFLVNGNHEQASRANFIDTDLIAPGVNTVTFSNIAVWAQTARNAYFPEPVADDFYGGMTNDVLPGIGSLRSCYSWTWGDALFVTLDPYWYSTNCVDNGYGLTQHPINNTWLITHGDSQYFWLKSTLEQSKAKYKFVFAHHVMGTGRGGADDAPFYEWGGENKNGTWGFATYRPTWSDPIHQLMVANNVTAFVQGHDHIFVRQQLDGLTYQTLPNPADNNYSLFNSDAYTQNLLYKTNNTGYTRFTISPTGAKVEYIRTILPTNLVLAAVGTNAAPPGVTNGQVDYSYVLYPLTAAGTANSPVTPSPTNAVWITTAITAGTNVSQVTLTYLANGLTNTVPMLDDGLHHDGAAGDGVYGAQIPAQPLGTLVRYFVHAVDAATRQLTDPSGAPLNPNPYSYTVGASTDSVGDGIADSWRAQYFGGDGTSTNAASAAAADPDGDGFSNYQEYLAGTNPTNALSFFHILSIDATPGQPVRFQSATNRTYTLYVRTNLLGGAWTAVPGQSNVPGTGGLMSLTNPLSADTERFFRLSVQ